MSKSVVITQPMLFPWVGMFEQYRLADYFVYYDDVQYSKGSFTNRVQIKTSSGSKWLTVPLNKSTIKNKINQVELGNIDNWRRSHLDFLSQVYCKSPFYAEMIDLVKLVYSQKYDDIGTLAISSMNEVCNYFGIDKINKIYLSSDLDIEGTSSQRVYDIVKYFNSNSYVTGHGAKNYLDHTLFAQDNIKVLYMDYRKNVYPQSHGKFTPFVSILDLIANTGVRGIEYINSNAIGFKDSNINI